SPMSPEFRGSSSSHPCSVSCGASRVIIFPPPVLVTFPGPVLSSCPQRSVLGPPGISPGPLGEEIPNSEGFAPKFGS
ncbi:KRFT protein, partial [Pardalotus punctatus]|nr:KRFT protein [Pardalotus punctatus]